MRGTLFPHLPAGERDFVTGRLFHEQRRHQTVTKPGRHARQGIAKWPRWLRKHAPTSPALLDIKRRADSCSMKAPCCCGACPRCIGRVQRWLSQAGSVFIAANPDLGPWKALSWVPGGQATHSFDLATWKRWFERHLRAVGLTVAIGGIDVSWNVDKRENPKPRHREGWAVQVWVVVRAAEANAAKKRLKKVAPNDAEIRRPIRCPDFDGRKRGWRYALKPNFDQRETYDGKRRSTGKPQRDTRLSNLTVAQKKELYPALGRAGIFGRVILIGAQIRWTNKGPAICRRRATDAS